MQRGLPMLEPVRHERVDAARNRATILAAAEALVAEHGAQCVTMDQVARAAGVGKGTLFRHFGDRCGLMRALLDERERGLQEGFIRGPAPLGPGAPPRERLAAFGERMLEHIEIQGDLLVAAENGAPGERLRHSVYAAYRAHITALLSESGYEGEIGYLADVLLGALVSELVLFQRRELGISQAQAEALLGRARAQPAAGRLSDRRRGSSAAAPPLRFASGIVGISENMSTPAQQIPALEIAPSERIPQLGFGVFQVPPKETELAVAEALSAGYRQIDTAAAYRNEGGVGEALHASGLDRDELFITTKCWNDDQGYEQAKRACRASLERLELSHLDLYLIHWPVPAHDLYVETWKAFVELHQEGLVRSIGVSNFEAEHLERVIAETGVTPAINQVELHPYFQQLGLRREHERLGILTEAWSPLGQGLELEDPAIVEIAQAHGKTPAQAIIRWHLQIGNVVIPKSVTPSRIRENIDVFDFELSEQELESLAALDAGRRIGPDPNTFVRP